MSLSDGQQISVIIHNICSAFLPFLLIIVGYRELRKWRSELIGKNKIELAQKIGRLAVRLNNQFQFCISPVTFGGEAEAREHEKDETPAETSQFDEAFARRNRLKTCLDTFTEIIEVLNEAEIIFNKDMQQYLAKYRKSLMDVNIALQMYFDKDRIRKAKFSDYLTQHTEDDQYLKDSHAIIYGINTKPGETVSKTTFELVTFAKQVMR